MPRSRALYKYLAHYAEPETQWLGDFPGMFQRALVIPFYREAPAALRRFMDFATRQPNTLLIIVSNRPDTDSDSDSDTLWHRNLLNGINSSPCWRSGNNLLTLFSARQQSALMLVDRVLAGAPIPAGEGVGLARKIGADIACRLFADQKIHSPWIANTDADAHLPDSYFQVQEPTRQAAALVYPYRHIVVDDCPSLSTKLYEFGLHYYVEGLRQAGSPYAFHTLGSTIAVHIAHYAAVRGFPRRNGAEDFYLLNKIVKTGAVVSLEHPVIDIEARFSNRVPFGTGPATTLLEQLADPLDYPLYHPAGFAGLAVFLQLLKQLAEQPQDYRPLVSGLTVNQDRRLDPDQLLRCCEHLQLARAAGQCFQQRRDTASRWRHFCDWFDGFKTLKFIHWLRDQGLGTIPFRDWSTYSHHWQYSGNRRMRELLGEIGELTCTGRRAGE